MIVDCHTHIRSLNEEEVAGHLAAAETVDACIVLARHDADRQVVNRMLAEYVGQHEDRMVGFGVVNPTEEKIGSKELAVLTGDMGFKGLVLYCAMSGFHPSHTRAMRFYELVEEAGVPIFFHNGSHSLRTEAVLEYTQPYLLDEVARAFPKLNIIIGNMGVPFVEQTVSMLSKHPRVFADLTIRPSKVWQTYNIVVAAHERGVMDKLLFGSGFPLSGAGECIETLLGFNMLFSDTKLPTVPRGSIRNVVERDSLELLGIEHDQIRSQENKIQTLVQGKQDK